MTTKICIVGLGYVGLPLAVAFGKREYSVLGLDTNRAHIKKLKQSKYTHVVKPLLKLYRGQMHPPSEYSKNINILNFE